MSDTLFRLTSVLVSCASRSHRGTEHDRTRQNASESRGQAHRVSTRGRMCRSGSAVCAAPKSEEPGRQYRFIVLSVSAVRTAHPLPAKPESDWCRTLHKLMVDGLNLALKGTTESPLCPHHWSQLCACPLMKGAGHLTTSTQWVSGGNQHPVGFRLLCRLPIRRGE